MGRNEYTFTAKDVFIDNGACVQCITQGGVYQGYGRYAPLKLTQKALKSLSKNCERVIITDHPYSGKPSLEVFYYKENSKVE